MQAFPSRGGVRWGTAKQTSKQTSALAQSGLLNPQAPCPCLQTGFRPSICKPPAARHA